MHILMLTEFFLPFERGGSELSVLILAQALVKKKHNVEVFTPNYGADSVSVFKGIKIFRFPYYLKLTKSGSAVSPFHQTHILWWLWTSFWLWKRILDHHPDMIHVQGKYFIPQAVVIGKIFNIPVIVTLRDYVVLCPHAYCLRPNRNYKKCTPFEVLFLDLQMHYRQFHVTSFWKKTYIFFGTMYGWGISVLLQFFLKRADQIVGISNKLNKIYTLNQIFISKTIYNTFSLPDHNPLKSQSYILFVGRLTEGKGFPLLIKAYSNLTPRNKPHLLIIGGDSLVNFQDVDNIKYLGHLPYQKTLEFISQARLVIVPAIWEEPFGRVALEAILLGVGVVATNRGGLPEIVEDNVTGLIVEPNVQSLVRGIVEGLQKSSKFRKNISKRLPQLRKKFESDPIIQYEKMYKNII